ncbi:D-3-phosphoglycerate dehydrogenase [Desulfotomaculum arcticum]|uniref:D-3-phosphoglycerate dehydrogenase n=1 Tax=Desulfotruncus arcticus DSM 17038 TaxID=1121424 RepID=A0A1I2WNI8_9FIRM|nr:hydroxyacid dehydrogenase [Desulfotruncus arcticus]SFH02928.1 D-3-phosphoglycerate dehydrogenase [Desulfotomaculum arcticum] [Desulfotruncus arcticus DSM 17038]
MAPKVLLTEAIHEEGMNIIKEAARLEIAADPGEETVIKAIADADALIVRSTKVTAAIIEAGKQLKVIGRHGIGLDNIDLEAANRCGVAVVNTPEANVMSVAEHVLATMLYLCKRIKEVDNALRVGEFDQPGSLPGLVTKLGYTTEELYGKTLGLVGFGKIARKTAELCVKGFNMKVCGYDAYLAPEMIKQAGVEPCGSLEEVFAKSDFISVHVPLTPGTRNLIGKKQLDLMKPTAYFINPSRGGVVNEEDLYQALKNKSIAGAAVDVFAKEPPAKDNPLFTLENIVVTPHIAAMTDGALVRMARDVSAGVMSVLRRERPQNLVNPEVWKD